MQVSIDGCKKEFEVSAIDEIERIKNMPCMVKQVSVGETKTGKPQYQKVDFPLFMQYVREVKTTNNGNPRDYEDIKADRNKILKRIGDFTCPMNWLEMVLDKIQNTPSTNTINTIEFFKKQNGKTNRRQISKIRTIIENFDLFVKNNYGLLNSKDGFVIIQEEYNNVITEVSKIKISNIATISRLIETALGIDCSSKGRQYKTATKYTRKTLNILSRTNKEKFFSCFKTYSEM